MKRIVYLIFGAVLCFKTLVLIGCKPKDNSDDKQKTNQTVNKMKQGENHYNELRQMALNVTHDQLGLETSDETIVFGIVMDWDLGDAIATVTAYKTGDASMYLSSGGGVIGGGQHDSVREAVFHYIKIGQTRLSMAEKTKTTPLPDKNCIRFYLLTNKGTYSAQENMENIENENSDWLRLFNDANKVLTELRLTTEEK